MSPREWIKHFRRVTSPLRRPARMINDRITVFIELFHDLAHDALLIKGETQMARYRFLILTAADRVIAGAHAECDDDETALIAASRMKLNNGSVDVWCARRHVGRSPANAFDNATDEQAA